MIAAAALALALAAPPSAAMRHGFLLDGMALREACRREDDLSTGLCVGYVAAAADQALFRDTTNSVRTLCLPPDLSNARLRAVVLAYLERETNGLRLPAMLYVPRALAEAYPCATTPAATAAPSAASPTSPRGTRP